MASSETPRTYQFANERTFVMAQGSVTNSTFHMHVASDSLRPEDCLRDLFLTDPAEDKNDLKRKKGNRAAGTCEWILGTEELNAWLDTGQGLTPENPATDILWLYGYPGTGKSTMSIFLAEELSNRFSATDRKTLSYFFCDSSFEKRKTATSVIRGLLWRLLQQHPPLLEYVLPKYAERGPELFKSFDALWAIFMDITADRTTGRKYCIIDALDECDRESQDTLLRELSQTFSPGNFSNRVSNIRILITSRPYPEIVEYLGEFANRNLASFRESQSDIERFINKKVATLGKRKRYSDQVTNQVTTALKDKAEGTFLWVGLACEELDRVASKDAVNYLQALPKGLHSLYNRLLDTALKQEGERDTIRCILSFVVASLRPLSLSELSVACQLHEGEDEETQIQFTRDEVASCRLMVIIQDEKVLLLHQSVKDFLVGSGADRFINVLEAHASFAHRCVDQLIWWFNQEPDMAPDDSFLSYSAQFWADHAHMAHSKFIIKTSEATFFKIHSDCREHWLAIYRSGFDDRIASQFSIFHVAGHWGIGGLVEFALDSQNYRASTPEYIDTDYVDSDGVSPLEEAARLGHKDVITCLLGRERSGSMVRPQILIAAARNEKNGKEVMALLFDQHGGRISITEDVVKAAMQNWTNGVEVTKLLLERWGDQVIVTEEVAKAAAQNWMNGTDLMILLLEWREVRVTITEGLVMTMADSFDEQVIARLLNRWGDDITITAEVIKAALGNEQNGREIAALLVNRRDDQITITEDMVRVAAGNEENGEAAMALLLHRPSDQITVTEMTAKMVAQLFDEGMMALLLDRRGDQIIITEGVVRAAASNEKSGKELMALLLDRRGDQIIITEGVVRAAASNEKSGKELMALLLDRRGDLITKAGGAVRAVVGRGYIELVRRLLDKGVDINIPNKGGWTPIYEASMKGYVDLVKLLLENGAGINIPNKDGWTPVYAASDRGHVDLAKLLLENGADIAITTNSGWTPIYEASLKGYVEVVKLLIENGADITVANNKGCTPVYAASLKGHVEVVKLLLENGADTTVTNNEGVTPVYVASVNRDVEVVKLLLENGADITVANNDGWSPVYVAVGRGHVDLVKLLLENGADINIPDNNGWTSVNAASLKGHVEIVKLLLENGADTTVANNEGVTPVYAASLKGHVEVVKLLLENGADITVANNNGWTPVNAASDKGHVEVVKLLLENGADTTVANNEGWSPVYVASVRGHAEVVKLLLGDPHIDPSKPDDLGRTALFFASRYGQYHAARVLLSEGRVNPNVRDWMGSTALFAAVANDHLHVAKLLITSGAAIEVQGGVGQSLIWWALRAGNPELLQLLVEHAETVGTQISDDHIPHDVVSTPFDHEAPWCDACTLSIHGGCRYSCSVCDRGFCLCMECYAGGIRSCDKAHVLVLQ